MQQVAKQDESHPLEKYVYERGTALALDEVQLLAQACPDAPRWPSTAWQAFLSHDKEDERHILLLARSPMGQLLGWLAGGGVLETAELEFVLVAPMARGLGIGRGLVCSWLKRMAEKGAREALLEVRPSNTAALRVYAELGFEVTGRRKGYYEEPKEDALLMRRALTDLDSLNGVCGRQLPRDGQV